MNKLNLVFGWNLINYQLNAKMGSLFFKLVILVLKEASSLQFVNAKEQITEDKQNC